MSTQVLFAGIATANVEHATGRYNALLGQPPEIIHLEVNTINLIDVTTSSV